MIQRYSQFWFFTKGSGNSISTAFCVGFFKKNVSHVILYQLTKFNCLIPITSWHIDQYVYYHWLLTNCCDAINFEINLIFLISCFSTWPKIQDKSLNILRTGRAFKMKQKAFFITFKALSVAKNCLRLEGAPLMNHNISRVG